MIHYPRDRTAKLVIRFEAGPLYSRGYFLKCSAPSLLWPKGTVPRVTGLTRVYCTGFCFPQEMHAMQDCVNQVESVWGLHRTIYRGKKHTDEYYEYDQGI